MLISNIDRHNMYTSGEFAAKAHITKKTLRYYNEHGFLKPSYIDEENGYKYYTNKDFERLQRILLLKYLGFSLEDIKNTEPIIENSHVTPLDTSVPKNKQNNTPVQYGPQHLIRSLEQQLGLVDERIKQMTVVREILNNTIDEVRLHGEADWTELLKQVTETGLRESLMQQYIDTSNISVRIRLHTLYSQATEQWFPWIYRNSGIKPGMNILEIGCGNGDFWLQNIEKLPKNINIILSDNSEGVLKEAESRFNVNDKRFNYSIIDIDEISLPDSSFDMVIANHVLFYAKNIDKALKEIRRILNPCGIFICSTYGPRHMKEISDLVKRFDDRIILAARDLYEIFGKTNGKDILAHTFNTVEWREYEDSLMVTDASDLSDYITSCHGNQNQYIIDRFKEFKAFVREETCNGFHVTKEAGIFICTP